MCTYCMYIVCDQISLAPPILLFVAAFPFQVLRSPFCQMPISPNFSGRTFLILPTGDTHTHTTALRSHKVESVHFRPECESRNVGYIYKYDTGALLRRTTAKFTYDYDPVTLKLFFDNLLTIDQKVQLTPVHYPNVCVFEIKLHVRIKRGEKNEFEKNQN